MTNFCGDCNSQFCLNVVRYIDIFGPYHTNRYVNLQHSHGIEENRGSEKCHEYTNAYIEPGLELELASFAYKSHDDFQYVVSC